MAARATWKGFLRIRLVNIPIKVFPATDAAGTISCNQLHQPPCGARIQQKKWCPTCDREVPSSEIVKGFEFEPGRYVVLTDADFEANATFSSRVIELVRFADAAALDPIYIDRTYYLAPDGRFAAAGYAVLLRALDRKVGIGKLAIYGREYLVAVRALEGGLALHTLHHAAEIRPLSALEDLAALPTPKPGEVTLARKLIAAISGELQLDEFLDEAQAGLQRIIDAKIAGKEIVLATPPEPAVTGDLEVALRESLEAALQKKRPAKVVAPRRRAS